MMPGGLELVISRELLWGEMCGAEQWEQLQHETKLFLSFKLYIVRLRGGRFWRLVILWNLERKLFQIQYKLGVFGKRMSVTGSGEKKKKTWTTYNCSMRVTFWSLTPLYDALMALSVNLYPRYHLFVCRIFSCSLIGTHWCYFANR